MSELLISIEKIEKKRAGSHVSKMI